MSHHYYCETAVPKRVRDRDRGRRYDTLKEKPHTALRESQLSLRIDLRLFLETGRKAF